MKPSCKGHCNFRRYHVFQLLRAMNSDYPASVDTCLYLEGKLTYAWGDRSQAGNSDVAVECDDTPTSHDVAGFGLLLRYLGYCVL